MKNKFSHEGLLATYQPQPIVVPPTIYFDSRDFYLNVRKFLEDCELVAGPFDEFTVETHITSGWRSQTQNLQAGGSPNSWHLQARAIDLADPFKVVATAVLKHVDLLHKYGLWLEDPVVTKTWVHLDNGVRADRLLRVFLP